MTSSIYRAGIPWKASQERVVVLQIQIRKKAPKRLGEKVCREYFFNFPRTFSQSQPMLNEIVEHVAANLS